MNQHTAKVVENPNNPEEMLLDLGKEICEQLGWAAGDQLEWIDNNDGTISLRKVEP